MQVLFFSLYSAYGAVDGFFAHLFLHVNTLCFTKKKKCDIKACVWLLQTQTKAVIRHCSTLNSFFFVLSVHYKASSIFILCAVSWHTQNENNQFVFLTFSLHIVFFHTKMKIEFHETKRAMCRLYQCARINIIPLCVCWYLCVTIHVLKTQMTNNSKHAGVHSEGVYSPSETYSLSGLHSQNLICHEDNLFFLFLLLSFLKEKQKQKKKH